MPCAPSALCRNKPSCARLCRNTPQAKSWSPERRAVARIEATPLGLDTRFVVTNVEYGAAEWIYDALYCARGQAENLIKLHKTQLASDRNLLPFRHRQSGAPRAAHGGLLAMLTVRDAIPKPRDLANAEFSTLRLRLIKIAARVIETATRVRLAFAAGCPEADLFRGLPGALAPLGLERPGKEPLHPSFINSNAFAKVSSSHGEIPERTRAPEVPQSRPRQTERRHE